MSNKYPTYFEDEVLNATPLKFVQLLYRGALDSIASARRYLRLGDIRARSLAISKAMADRHRTFACLRSSSRRRLE